MLYFIWNTLLTSEAKYKQIVRAVILTTFPVKSHRGAGANPAQVASLLESWHVETDITRNTHIHTYRRFRVNLTRTSLDYGRKPEKLEKTQAGEEHANFTEVLLAVRLFWCGHIDSYLHDP